MIDLFVSGALLLCLDQWSKRMIDAHVAGRSIALAPALRLRRTVSVRKRYNHNAFRAVMVLVWVTALASAIILHRSGVGFQSRAALLGLGAAIGGAAGNLLDILRDGFVADFIDFRWWPAFNVADTAIVGGLAVAFLLS